MGLLDTWTLGDHRASGVRHPTYRKGTGPGVIVIHEIPGLTPDGHRVRRGAGRGRLHGRDAAPVRRAREADEPADASRARCARCASRGSSPCSRPGRPPPSPAGCGRLARELHAELGGPGVGALGMCFTGGFALAMMVDDAVAAPVAGPAVDAVPGLPRPVPRPQPLRRRPRHGQGAGGRRVRGAGPALPKDPAVGKRFERLTEEIGDRFIRVELEGRGHSTSPSTASRSRSTRCWSSSREKLSGPGG